MARRAIRTVRDTFRKAGLQTCASPVASPGKRSRRRSSPASAALSATQAVSAFRSWVPIVRSATSLPAWLRTFVFTSCGRCETIDQPLP